MRRQLFPHCAGIRLAIFLVPLWLLTFVVSASEDLPYAEPDWSTVSSSALYFDNQHGLVDAPLLDTSVDVSITGLVARVTLTQRFRNDSTDWVEGLYVFPLPDKAAVNSLNIKIGEREIVGSVQEKQQAEKNYEAAKKAGHVAGLVKQHRPNLFSSRFANVPPGESISIELGYIQTVRFDHDRFNLRIPLTLTPRYSNDLVADAPAITPPQLARPANHDHSTIDHRVSIETTLFGSNDSVNISSPSHQLTTQPIDNGTKIVLNEQAYLDRDFVLEWHEQVDAIPAVQIWRESVQGEDYLLASVMPPTDEQDIPVQPRELVLVIDTSGSMAGVSIEAAKAALLDALGGLKPQDKFNIIEFNNSFTQLFKQPEQATLDNITRGERFTQKLQANGGTEMMGALRTALRYPDSELLRQIVFITDGSVGYENNVIDSIRLALGDSRLFTVGIGAAPSQWFMRKVAEAGRGTHHTIDNLADVTPEMVKLLHKLESPTLTDIEVTFNDGSAEVQPGAIPDLYAKQPVMVAAKLFDDAHTMTVSGTWGGDEWQTQVPINVEPVKDAGLSTVWARQKIESLQDKQRLNGDPEQYKSLILRLALDHQLVSPYTAFIAIEKEPVRPLSDTLKNKPIPNVMPAGSTMQSINLPQGSAGIDTLLLVCLICLIVSLFSIGHRKLLQTKVW